MATETGGSDYPQGPEGFTAGALPPPGTYFLNYVEHYTAGRFNDGNGHAGFFPDFQVAATADVLRVVQVDKITVLGASVGHAVILPVVDLSVGIGTAHDRRSGIGDMTLTPLILGWHGKSLHAVAALDIYAPTGAYSQNRLANIGRNAWAAEPVLALAYYPKGGFTVDVKLMYDFNGTNRQGNINPLNPTGADYRSGQEFHADFAVGQQVGKVQLGVSGYVYRQTTGDKVANAAAQATLDALGGLKGKAFALGPSAHLNLGKVMLIGTYQHEFQADYRPQGDKFWVKAVIPLR
ncbi:MAG TPA: transporter [Novosphingobium sp.]|nr:transporter [Novosphingobium sp.]